MTPPSPPTSAVITGKTRLLGLIADPVKHVMSPVMHNAMIRHKQLDYVYIPIHVQAPDLQSVVNALRKINMDGWSVTLPHKVAIMAYLDEVDPKARRIGAVNTVKNENGHLRGRNTDGEGGIKSLRDADFRLKDRYITILGAGGAARALLFNLIDFTPHITVINRSRTPMEQLILDASQRSGVDIRGEYFGRAQSVRQIMKKTDLLINTTPIGMAPLATESPIPSAWLRPEMDVFDVIYTPLQTKLLRDAHKVGCKTLGGLDMLVNQGALAFEWWTNAKADPEVMRAVVLQELEN